jgi:rubrerythrin
MGKRKMVENIETPFRAIDFIQFANTKDENIIIGINIGIEIETQSRNFYQSIARNMSQDKRFILKFLANEELEHIKILIAFKTALQNNGKWIDLNQKQLKKIRKPKLYEGKSSIPLIRETDKDTDILLAAMRAEKRGEQFYKRVGKKVKDKRATSFFDFLSKFERGHYTLLKNLLQTS